MRSKKILDKDLIEEKKFLLTEEELAQTFSCSARTLRRFCLKENIHLPTKSEKVQFKLINFFNTANRKTLPKAINDLADLIGVSHVLVRDYLNREKIHDLKIAEETLINLKKNKKPLISDNDIQVEMKKVKKIRLLQDRVSREIKLILETKQKRPILLYYENVEQFKNLI